MSIHWISAYFRTYLRVVALVGLSLFGMLMIVAGPVHATESKLSPLTGSQFGYSVSMSGNTALIGSPSTIGGSAYVFTFDGQHWSQQAKLNSAITTDHFGSSVSISGNIALVGAYADSSSRGAVYVFTRTGTTWTQEDKLTASDGASDDLFGVSLSLSGNTALIGAPHDGYQAVSYIGAAYVFVRTGSTWSQEAKIVPSDAVVGDNFGHSVSLSGDTALVASIHDDSGYGSAYVFVRTGSVWSQQAELTANDRTSRNALTWNYGNSVSLNGNTALVGANYAGAAYVYQRTGTSWSQEDKVTGPNYSGFANSVSVSGGIAVVGAPSSNAPGVPDPTGATYVFYRTGTRWAQKPKLLASDGLAGDAFGTSVFLDGNNIIIGAPHANGISLNTGAAYVYDLTTAPSAVANLHGTLSEDQVALSWDAPSSNGGSPVTNYRVYRGIASGSEVFLSDASSTTYTDTGLGNGVSYYYQVTAVNSVGEGPPSNEVSFNVVTHGGLKVTVYDQNGQPIQGATVAIAGGPTQTTGADGTTTFNMLIIGNYNVHVSATGYTSASKTVTVTFGQVASETATLTLLPTKGKLKVSVSGGGNTLPGATVTITSGPSSQPLPSAASTASDGTVTFDNLAPGVYTYKVTASGFVDKEETVTITAGETSARTTDLTLVQTTTQFSAPLSITTIILIVGAGIVLALVLAVFGMVRRRRRPAGGSSDADDRRDPDVKRYFQAKLNL